jgi:hypothetical protein
MSQAETLALEPTQTAPPPHSPKYKRLTRADLGIVFAMHRAGKSQVEIAEHLNCNQSTISKWLADYQDTTVVAKEYLRGQALRLAQRVVKKGTPTTDVAVLKGLTVLQDEQQSGLTIIVGSGSQVQLNVGVSHNLPDAESDVKSIP